MAAEKGLDSNQQTEKATGWSWDTSGVGLHLSPPQGAFCIVLSSPGNGV